jgi:hypothetical protein
MGVTGSGMVPSVLLAMIDCNHGHEWAASAAKAKPVYLARDLRLKGM